MLLRRGGARRHRADEYADQHAVQQNREHAEQRGRRVLVVLKNRTLVVMEN